MKSIEEFSSGLQDFILNRGMDINDEFECSSCPAWYNDYCMIREMWFEIPGLTCHIDKENHRVKLIKNGI